jgi:ubiquinone/menaquinone biosynthesis C-methylase UbiE
MEDQPKERILGNYFNDYLDLPFEPFQEYFRKLHIVQVLSKSSHLSAVEIGCGRQSIFSVWQPGGSALIIEPIDSFLKFAADALEKQQIHNVNFFKGTLDDYVKSNQESSYDVTFLSSILHEISDSDHFLSQAKKITKLGGKIIIVVPNKQSVHRILGVELGFQDSINSKTETEKMMQQVSGAFSFDELEKKILQAGLIVEKMESFFVKIFPHKTMQLLIDNLIISETDLRIFDRLSDYLPGLGSEILAVAKVPG